MTKSRIILFIVYGMFLGVCMGALSSLASLTLLHHFGRPNFLIRPGWEILNIQFLIISGGLVGLFFGILLCSMKSYPNTHRSWLFSHILMLIGASSVNFGFDYLAIKWRVVALNIVSHPLVFLWCLSIIYLFEGNLKK